MQFGIKSDFIAPWFIFAVGLLFTFLIFYDIIQLLGISAFGGDFSEVCISIIGIY